MHCNRSCIKADSTTGITELADGDEALVLKVRDDVDLSGSWRKMFVGELGYMSRCHVLAVWITDGDGMSGHFLVDDLGVECCKVAGGSGICNFRFRWMMTRIGGGRTTC